MNEWLMSKKTADANQFAHLHNVDNVEKSQKKLRDQANSKTFKEFIKKGQDSNKKANKQYARAKVDSSIKDR